jgi:hypothetical protein
LDNPAMAATSWAIIGGMIDQVAMSDLADQSASAHQ